MTILERFEATLRGPWITVGDDVQCRIERDGCVAKLFFQCSASRSDWYSNFDFPAVPYKRQPKPWMAHRGFVSKYHGIRDWLSKEMVGVVRLEVSGYSHGGALAVLAHEDMSWNEGIDVESWCFGSPRVLWLPPRAVADRFKRLTRVVVRGDLVAHVPPAILGYRHVGNLHSVGPLNGVSWVHHRAEEYVAALGGAV